MEQQSAFEQAIDAIDKGDQQTLEQLIADDPGLLSQRYHTPDNGYFARPYLLWFIANNPTRRETMAKNIVEITGMMIDKAKEQNTPSLQEQLEYTLALVVGGRVPREQGVQIPLADMLITAGARPGGVNDALAHHNFEVARFLLEKGVKVELISAVCLDLPEAATIMSTASAEEKLQALIAASFFGKVAAVQNLLNAGANVNGYAAANGFHSHATALHQAVYSGSAESVKLLIEAGADLYATDKIYHGTPLGWAEYGMTAEENDAAQRKQYGMIAALLREKMDRPV